jgi:predicted mannosyl-3-phosphoglycerate phosphatase (HAD superfamily)
MIYYFIITKQKSNMDLIIVGSYLEIKNHYIEKLLEVLWLASILINNGASIMVVSKYLDHTKIYETLNSYSHLFINKLDEITKNMDLLE